MTDTNAKRGYLLLATTTDTRTQPFYYYAAVDLAISMKTDKGGENGEATKYPIALVCCGRIPSIEPELLAVFDQIITMKPEHVMPFYSKTVLNQYSPFEETIYLDVDGMCVANPDYLFYKCAGTNFCAHLDSRFTKDTGHTSKVVWCDIPELFDYYDLPRDRVFNEINSSFLYWDSSQKASDIFTLAEHFYACEWYEEYFPYGPVKRFEDKPKVGHYPDELAFEIAMLFADHRIPFKANPIYFQQSGNGGVVSWKKVAKDYPIIGLYGANNFTSGQLWKVHDSLRIRLTREYERQKGIAPGTLHDGYRLDEKQKAGNGVGISGTFKGIRERVRPETINKIIKRYGK